MRNLITLVKSSHVIAFAHTYASRGLSATAEFLSDSDGINWKLTKGSAGKAVFCIVDRTVFLKFFLLNDTIIIRIILLLLLLIIIVRNWGQKFLTPMPCRGGSCKMLPSCSLVTCKIWVALHVSGCWRFQELRAPRRRPAGWERGRRPTNTPLHHLCHLADIWSF